MTDKQAESEGEARKPVQTLRNGAIGGSVWLKQSAAGYWYYHFSLSRSWKSTSTAKDGYSSGFFDRNREELHKTVDECCDYIEAMVANAETITIDTTEQDKEPRKALSQGQT